MAEALGRYSNLGDTGAAARAAQERARLEARPESWKVSRLGGGSGTRQALAGQEATVLSDYASGMGSVSLSRRYGVPVSTLLDWLRQQGAEIRSGGKLSAEDMVDVRRLRAEGWSHQKIADRFGVTRSAISIRLKAEAADGSV